MAGALMLGMDAFEFRALLEFMTDGEVDVTDAEWAACMGIIRRHSNAQRDFGVG